MGNVVTAVLTDDQLAVRVPVAAPLGRTHVRIPDAATRVPLVTFVIITSPLGAAHLAPG